MVEPTGTAGTEGPVALTLHQAATLVGAYRWAEDRLFALTGRWSSEATMTPAVQVHLFEASRGHAERAEAWAERLPVLAGMDPVALARPIGVLEPLLSALAAEEGAAARLAGLQRVVRPALDATYRRHLARVSPVADLPVARTLRMALADLEEDLVAGAAVLDGLLAEGVEPRGASGEDTGRAAARAAAGRLGPLVAGADGCWCDWPVPVPSGVPGGAGAARGPASAGIDADERGRQRP